jgi:hypothetical protein
VIGPPSTKVSLTPKSNQATGTANITLLLPSGDQSIREVGGLAYLIGRRGSLDYLSPSLLTEVLDQPANTTTSSTTPAPSALITGRTLRAKASTSLEVAQNVFIIGSLAGDSLIRHAFGGCVYAAGRILSSIPSTYSPTPAATPLPSTTAQTPELSALGETRATSPALELDLDGSSFVGVGGVEGNATGNGAIANGHEDLHIDRRKLAKRVEIVNAENRVWVGSGWWAGGVGFGFGA